jgi:hypothetical protein
MLVIVAGGSQSPIRGLIGSLKLTSGCSDARHLLVPPSWWEFFRGVFSRALTQRESIFQGLKSLCGNAKNLPLAAEAGLNRKPYGTTEVVPSRCHTDCKAH